MFLLLRIENGLLRKQNVITSQVEYYYFVDGVHHIFLAPAINPKEIIFFFPPPPSPPSVDGLYMTVFEDVATNVATFTGQQSFLLIILISFSYKNLFLPFFPLF